jgi:hypothetical protein
VQGIPERVPRRMSSFWITRPSDARPIREWCADAQPMSRIGESRPGARDLTYASARTMVANRSLTDRQLPGAYIVSYAGSMKRN